MPAPRSATSSSLHRLARESAAVTTVRAPRARREQFTQREVAGAGSGHARRSISAPSRFDDLARPRGRLYLRNCLTATYFAQSDVVGPLIELRSDHQADATDSRPPPLDGDSPEPRGPSGAYPVGPESEGDQGLPFSRDPSLDSLLAPSFVRIEQEAADWLFSGTWTDHSLSQASGGSYWRNATAGGTAELTFNGTWVSVGLIADRSSGEAELFIDNISQGVIDLYRIGSFSEAMPVSFSFDGLDPGPHTLKIEVLGTANPSSFNTRVQLDYVDYGDGSLLPDGSFEEDDERVLVSNGWRHGGLCWRQRRELYPGHGRHRLVPVFRRFVQPACAGLQQRRACTLVCRRPAAGYHRSLRTDLAVRRRAAPVVLRRLRAGSPRAADRRLPGQSGHRPDRDAGQCAVHRSGRAGVGHRSLRSRRPGATL